MPASSSLTGTRLVVLALGVICFAAIGTFGGLWMWSKYTKWQEEAALADSEKAAAAERMSPRGLQREAVLFRLNDRSSAQFRSERQSRSDSKSWCGEVNARNRMGAMVGFRRYIASASIDPAKLLEAAKQEPVSPGELKEIQENLFSVDIDPDSPSSGEQDAFNKRWSVYCY